MAKLSILIPVYNEAGTIAEVLRRVRATDLGAEVDKQVIVVDDGSTDDTRATVAAFRAAAPDLDLALLTHPINRGKGAALRTALASATGDILLVQDADLEYDPRDYPALLVPLLDGRADVVYGSRFLGGPHRVLFFWHYLGNRLLTLLSNALTNLNLSDMETGYKLFRREILQRIPLRSNRFGIEPEITAKVAKQGCRIYEVPISYSGRTYGEGKKITWRDGFVALWCILRYRLVD